MSGRSDETTLGPIELLESARTKYQLALGRLRRGPPELALLSIHGAIEDVLRAHGLRAQLDAAYEPFAQLLDALTQDRQKPLSAAEAEGIRRMHRLRARVAHGEQIVVTAETINAYQRLAARLLPRYGVLIVGPEGEAAAGEGLPATTTTTVARRGDTMSILRGEPALPRRGDTVSIEREPPAPPQPRRERTVYPDGASSNYLGRAGPSRATADLPLAREWADAGRFGRGGAPGRRAGPPPDIWARWQGWLLPGLAIVCIFLIGAVISVALQQLRSEPIVPTAAVPAATAFVPQITTAAAETSSVGAGAAPAPAATAAPPAPTEAPAGALAPGRTAYVRPEAIALNVRARAGTAADNPVIFSLAPGTAVEVLGGPTEADGFTWWQVRGPTGEGWCAGQFLEVR